MMIKAYWISPEGEIIPIKGLDRHIDIICNKPELFGLEIENVNAVFREFNEPIGWEGYAREQIMIELLGKGWIRVRYIERFDVLTVEFSTFSEKKKVNIMKWARKITNGEIDNVSEYANIRLLNSKGEEDILSIKKLLSNIKDKE